MEPAAIAGLVLIGLFFLAICFFLVRLGWMIVASVTGLARATSGGPGPALRAWGWTVESNVMGGEAQGAWKDVPVQVRWTTQVSPDVGGVRRAPQFATELRVLGDADRGGGEGPSAIVPEVLSDPDRLRAALDALVAEHLGGEPPPSGG